MLVALLVNKPKIEIGSFYHPQKQKSILDFLLNKFQKRSFLKGGLDFFLEELSLFKKDDFIYHQGGDPKFHYQKKYIIKINNLKFYKKLIKCSNKIKLDNKLIYPYPTINIKKKIEYMIFKVFFNEGRNGKFRRKVILLGYKFLELKIVFLGKIFLLSFKEGDLRLFNLF